MLGIAHRVAPSDIDETVLPGEDPERYTKRLAQAKALAVHTLNDKEIVLGADTTRPFACRYVYRQQRRESLGYSSASHP